MNNEPVAIRYDFDGYGYQYIDSGSGSDWLTRVDGEPLYTHPAKTLTDEEIIETVKDHFIGAIKLGIVLTNDNVLGFARAILKKASEK
jgi:hypothetical protein